LQRLRGDFARPRPAAAGRRPAAGRSSVVVSSSSTTSEVASEAASDVVSSSSVFDTVSNTGVAIVRRGHVQRRLVRRVDENTNARNAIGDLEPGVELVAVSAGRFTLAGVVSHVLATTGPGAVWLCVGGVAAADLGTMHQLTAGGAISSLRLLVDFQVAARPLELVELVRNVWGGDCLRVGMVHAGFAVIRNDRWNVVVRTTAGLSACHRLELFELSDNAVLADFLVSTFEAVSEAAPAGNATRVEHNAGHDRAFPRSKGGAIDSPPGSHDAGRPGVSYR
jgi:hypothetical protein